MPTSKKLLILANSIKHYPCVCIAGREITSVKSEYEIGPWIRPVSTHGEGELSQSEITMTDGQTPEVMEFVDIPLRKCAADPLQPENWIIVDTPKWKNISGHYAAPTLEECVDNPDGLWLKSGERPDRISNAYLTKHPPTSSICLIKVTRVRIRFEWSSWEGQSKKRYRAIFKYKGVEYDLSITDPVFTDKYRKQFPAPGSRPIEFAITGEGGIYLCISLTPPLGGYHYKVVATIFDS